MKKFTCLFIVLVALLMSAGTSRAQNIYAYDLKVSDSGVNPETKQVRVSYKLNVAASAVEFEVPGCTVVSTTTPGLTPGVAHEVTLTLTGLPAEGGELAWKVKATGAAAAPGTPTCVTTQTEKFTMVTPRNIAVDNSFDSPHFGNVYVLNAYTGAADNGTTDQRNQTERGVYIYNPRFDRLNSVDAGTSPQTIIYTTLYHTNTEVETLFFTKWILSNLQNISPRCYKFFISQYLLTYSL